MQLVERVKRKYTQDESSKTGGGTNKRPYNPTPTKTTLPRLLREGLRLKYGGTNLGEIDDRYLIQQLVRGLRISIHLLLV